MLVFVFKAAGFFHNLNSLTFEIEYGEENLVKNFKL